ncbi:MAG TPA: alpha/beta hydrolase domain-containing protein, partial [Vicinamibacterales bacterium]
LTPVTRIASELIRGGAGAGTPLPLLVPQVDGDGNERAGIRLPDVAVPLATYPGWNFRRPAIGAPDRIVPLLGSYVPFPRTAAEREAQRDPRRSIAERYPSRDSYMSQIAQSAAALVKDGFLLEEDTVHVTRRAADHWDLLMRATTTSAQR